MSTWSAGCRCSGSPGAGPNALAAPQAALISALAKGVLGGDLKQIKREKGGNSYRLIATRADGTPGEPDLDRVGQVPGVEQVIAQNGAIKLLLRPEAEGPDVLRELVQFLRVHEFRSEEPELEQIFLKAVRDAA